MLFLKGIMQAASGSDTKSRQWNFSPCRTRQNPTQEI